MNYITMRRVLLFCIVLATSANVFAKVKLPRLFSDGVVLQRGQVVPVWGEADANEPITLTMGKKSYSTQADEQGKWRIDLPKMKAGGPFQIVVNDITIHDVWVGDVWLFSGQSNIDIHLERVYPQYPEEIENDVNDKIHLFKVENTTDTHHPLNDVRTQGWKTLNKQNGWHFTAIGYFLGKQMFAKTGVPQGIIQSSWGGTPIEAWLPADSMRLYAPMKYAETCFYQDDALVQGINRVNNQSNNRWFETLNQCDPGISGEWVNEGFDDSQWTEVNQFSLPVRGRFCGSYWLRQHIRIDAAHAGKSAQLLLGTLYDADFTFVNGKQVGHTSYQYPPRRYQIPEGLLHEGDNVITVRFVNKQGAPSFVREKPYRLVFSKDDVQPLSESWRVHDGVQMPNQPSIPFSAQNLSSVLYNAMLSPLAPFALSGAVWYQGESNTGRPHEYLPYLNCLKNSWRERFQQPNLPFVIVQLANYMAPSAQPQNSNWAALREAQHLSARADNRAELAVAIDLGEANDIHPLRKKEVAERVTLAFDKLVFGKKVMLSPELVSVSQAGEQVILTFDQPLQEGNLHEFELAGADRKFQNVTATAKGNTVTLSAIPGACIVRYAWKDNPAQADCRALNSSLPAVPFERTF